MKYTQHSKEADETIANHFKLVCDKIKQEVKDLKSILIMGGFAKGEGSVKKVGDKIEPMNDYDFYLITKEKIPEQQLDKLSEECSNAIGKKGLAFDHYEFFEEFDNHFFVELHNLTESELKDLLPIIRYYEIKNSGKVLYGEDAIKLFPDFRLEEIPDSEIIRLIFNRLVNLIQYFKADYLKKLPKKQETLLYFTNRAILTAGSVFLFYLNRWETHNQKALETLEEVFPKQFPHYHKKFPKFLEDLRNATKWKLVPYSVEIEDPVALWFRARTYLSELAKLYIKEITKKNPQDWEEVSKAMQSDLPKTYYHPYLKHMIKTKTNLNSDILAKIFSFSKYYLNLRFFLKLKKEKNISYPSIILNKTPLDLKIFSTVPLLINAIQKNGAVNQLYLRKVYKELRKVYPIKPINAKDKFDLWNQTAKTYGDVHAHFFFQKLL